MSNLATFPGEGQPKKKTSTTLETFDDILGFLEGFSFVVAFMTFCTTTSNGRIDPCISVVLWECQLGGRRDWPRNSPLSCYFFWSEISPLLFPPLNCLQPVVIPAFLTSTLSFSFLLRAAPRSSPVQCLLPSIPDICPTFMLQDSGQSICLGNMNEPYVFLNYMDLKQ